MGLKSKISYVVILFLLASVTIFLLSPANFFTARGHSMEPSIQNGDGIFVLPTSREDIRVGDIISFQSEGFIITHRVVGIDEELIKTKGDNISHKDPNPVKYSQVVGEVVLIIPYLGIIVSSLNTTWGLILLLLIPAGLLIYIESRKIHESLKKEKKAI